MVVSFFLLQLDEVKDEVFKNIFLVKFHKAFNYWCIYVVQLSYFQLDLQVSPWIYGIGFFTGLKLLMLSSALLCDKTIGTRMLMLVVKTDNSFTISEFVRSQYKNVIGQPDGWNCNSIEPCGEKVAFCPFPVMKTVLCPT